MTENNIPKPAPAPTTIRTEATSDDIERVAQKVEDALVGESLSLSIMSMLSLIVLIQKPNCTPEQLQSLVRDTSHFICLALDSVEALPGTDPGITFATPSSRIN